MRPALSLCVLAVGVGSAPLTPPLRMEDDPVGSPPSHHPTAQLPCVGFPAQQLFVSPNGSDAGDGSAAHPFATLRRAQQG